MFDLCDKKTCDTCGNFSALVNVDESFEGHEAGTVLSWGCEVFDDMTDDDITRADRGDCPRWKPTGVE